MNADEVNSRLMGCTVRLEGGAIEVVVLSFTTGHVPEIFVRWASGRKSWEPAAKWVVVKDPVDPKRAVEAIRRQQVTYVPERAATV